MKKLTVARFHEMIKDKYVNCPFCDKMLSKRCIDVVHNLFRRKFDYCPNCEKCMFNNCIDDLHSVLRYRFADSTYYDVKSNVDEVVKFHGLIEGRFDKCPFCYKKLMDVSEGKFVDVVDDSLHQNFMFKVENGK